MLCVERLKLTNFRSWKKFSFQFPDGITAIVGKNGSGKSSIRLAIQLALVGNVPKLNLQDLIREGATNFNIELDFEYNNTIYTLKKQKGETKVKKAGMSTFTSVRDLKFLESLKVLSSFIFLTQDTAQFVDLPDSKRKEFLGKLLPQLSIIRDDSYYLLSDYLSKIEDKLLTITQRHEVAAITESNLTEELNRHKALFKQEMVRFKQRQRILKGLKPPFSEKVYKKLVTEQTALNKSIMTIKKKIDNLDLTIKNLEKFKLEQEYLKKKIADKKRVIQQLELEIESKNTILEDTLAICPNCNKQLICANCNSSIVASPEKRKQIEKELIKLTELLEQRKREYKNLQKQYNDKFKNADPDSAIEKSMGEKLKLHEELNQLEYKIASINSKVKEYDDWKLQKMTTIEDNKETIVKLKSYITGIERELKEVRNAVKRLDKTKSVLSNLRQNLLVLTKIFRKTLPDIYIREFLKEFSVRVNYIGRFLGDIDIRFKDYEDKVLSLINGRPYHMASTGEQQRAKIATTLGFALLYGNCSFFVADEIFDVGLDTEGLEKLAYVVGNVLPKHFKKIIIISHNERLLDLLPTQQIINLSDAGDTFGIE